MQFLTYPNKFKHKHPHFADIQNTKGIIIPEENIYYIFKYLTASL